jgi:hypothetical protein
LGNNGGHRARADAAAVGIAEESHAPDHVMPIGSAGPSRLVRLPCEVVPDEKSIGETEGLSS